MSTYIQPKVHVWITKSTLRTGIIEETEATIGGHNNRYVSYGSQVACKPDWHTSESEARTRVRHKIAAELNSLRKTLAWLEKLRAEFEGGTSNA